ncbi:hypothetical protein DFJ74DRAFT_688085 [Hyaloraphidium curvatum]|nr:hypothetical protein DFJ74DRAFT_688085 [Hyaloraphidium curvatum]
MPSYRASSASASDIDEDDGFGMPRRRLRPRRTDSEHQPFEQDTLAALITPSCVLTIKDNVEDTAVQIALPESMTSVTALPVPAISQTVNENIEIPHFRLLGPDELAALATRQRKPREPKEDNQPEQMSDEAFEARHRKYEREEKRLKNREMEIVRHEMWKKREAAERKKYRDFSRTAVGGRKGSVPPEDRTEMEVIGGQMPRATREPSAEEAVDPKARGFDSAAGGLAERGRKGRPPRGSSFVVIWLRCSCSRHRRPMIVHSLRTVRQLVANVLADPILCARWC